MSQKLSSEDNELVLHANVLESISIYFCMTQHKHVTVNTCSEISVLHIKLHPSSGSCYIPATIFKIREENSADNLQNISQAPAEIQILYMGFPGNQWAYIGRR